MYEDIIFKRFPRHDSDFLWTDSSPHWDDHNNELSVPWTHTALTFLWITILFAAILWICARSPLCPCYNCLFKFRRAPPRSEFTDNWTRNHVLVVEERNQPTAPPATLPTDAEHFEDPPPDYFQVVKADLPPYPTTPPIATQIPEPAWTGRTQTDPRNINININI